MSLHQSEMRQFIEINLCLQTYEARMSQWSHVEQSLFNMTFSLSHCMLPIIISFDSNTETERVGQIVQEPSA